MKKESAARKAKFFQQCTRLMRRRDGQSKEEGYHLLLPRALEFVTELLEEAMTERNDPGLRSWLYELLRETKSPLPIDHYKSLLASVHEEERQWAVKGLKAIDTPESRKLLFEAGLQSARRRGTACQE